MWPREAEHDAIAVDSPDGCVHGPWAQLRRKEIQASFRALFERFAGVRLGVVRPQAGKGEFHPAVATFGWQEHDAQNVSQASCQS